MGLLHLLIAALLPSVAAAACGCVNTTQTYDSIGWPLMFFQQPTEGGVQNGKTCNMDCTFTANLDSDDPKKALQVQLLTSSLGSATLTINGMETIFITSNTPLQTFPQHSYGASITIDFKESDVPSNLATFMLVVSKVDGRADPPVQKTTTTSAPTAAYDPKFTHNPRLVADDIMFVFDLGSDNIDKYKKFATDIINELTINPKAIQSTEAEDCDVGSRLSNVGLSPISGFTTFTSPYWTANSTQATGNINAMFQIGSGRFYLEPLKKTYIYGFGRADGASDDEAYTLCKNRGKILVLLSSSSPVEYNLDNPKVDPLDIDFLGKGVHQILVQYGMSAKDYNYYNISIATNNKWNFFELTGGDKDVENFFNTFLVDSSDDMTCQLKSKTTQTEVEIGAPAPTATPTVIPVVDINLPSYYDGKGVTDGKWGTVKHYCNFQETTINLKRDKTIVAGSDGKVPIVPVCVKVYYDLETGKDFVSIFSGDPTQPSLQTEVVRLTGRDVSGTSFDLPDAIGSIVFTSDEKNVFDGFHAEITRGECE